MEYMKGYRLKSWIAIGFKFIEAVFELLMPLVMVWMIDQGIHLKNQTILWQGFWLLMIFTVLGYLASLVCQYLASAISQEVGGRMRHTLFQKMMTFTFTEYDLYPSSVLSSRITNDVNQVQEMIAKTIRLGARAPLLMIGSLVAVYQINAQLAMYLLWSFPVFVVVVVAFMWGSLKLHTKAQKDLDAVSFKAQEDLSGVRIIRAFSKADAETKVFAGLNQQLERAQRAVGVIASLSTPATSLIMNMVCVLLVWLSASMINTGSMTQGQIIAVISYCTQLVLTLIIFMNLVMIFSRGMTSYGRIQEIVHTEIKQSFEGTRILESGPIEIEFEHVSFSFPGESRRVLSDINFKLKKHETLGILGLTGSGKSIIVKLLMRFYDVSAGRILVNGFPIESYDITSLRQGFGYVSQKSQFMSGDLASNIAMDRMGDIKRALDHAQGADISQKGFDAKIESQGQNLSGGQRQRVNIARALLQKPGLVVLDDAFSALDYLTDRKLRTVLEQEYDTSSFIFISTRTSSLMHADQIMILSHGVVEAMGTHAHLLQENDTYKEIHALQANEVDQ